MPDRSEAEEHLRVIRSLMERATLYRAVSAPGAAVGALLAIAASFAFGSWLPAHSPAPPAFPVPAGSFVYLWAAILVITTGVNFGFLWKDTKIRGTPFFSPGMRMALGAVLPSYAVAACWTWYVGGGDHPSYAVPVWIICHGIGLLATSHFAPRSLVCLGWAFLIAGVLSMEPVAAANALDRALNLPLAKEVLAARDSGILEGQLWMACTFGLFHLIYAICAWPRKRAEPDPALKP